MRISFRQGIVTAPADFLQPSGTRVDLALAPPALITVAFADGITNYLHTERFPITNAWSGPFQSGTDYWLYWDLNTRTGVRTFGHTTLAPVDGATAPASPSNDQHWYDTIANKMKVWNGITSQWIPKIRVFAAKLQSGAIPISVSVNSPSYLGTQVGSLQNTPVSAGALVFDLNGDPVKRSNNVFFTTEDIVSANISTAAQIKLGAVLIEAVTVANIPAYSVVQFVDFHQVNLASGLVNVNGAYGIVEQDGPTGAIVNVAMEGIVTNPEWDWSALPVNAPLYLGSNGELTGVAEAQPIIIGTVVDANTILLRAAIVTYGESGGSGGADLIVQDEGVDVETQTTTINFGTGLDVVAGAAGVVTVSAIIPPATPSLEVQDDTVTVETETAVINFGTGLDVVAGVDGSVTVNASGGGSSFDQDLNTFDNVQFASVETASIEATNVVTDSITTTENGSLTVTLPTTNAPTWFNVVGDATIDSAENFPTGIAYNSANELAMLHSTGSGLVYVTQFDNDGTVKWQTELTDAGGLFTVPTGIAIDTTDDSVYAIIYFEDVVTNTTVIKLNNAGVIQWQQSLVCTDDPSTGTLIIAGEVNAAGELVLVGTAGYIDVTPFKQVIVVKMSALGAVIWSQSIRPLVPTTDLNANGIGTDGAGNLYISYTKPVGVGPITGSAAAKLSSAGTVLWEREFEMSTASYSGHIAVNTGSGEAVVSFRSDDFIGYRRLDTTDGTIIRERAFTDLGSPGTATVTGIGIDTDGSVYLGGTISDGVTQGNLFASKFSGSDLLTWQRTFGGALSEFDNYYYAISDIAVRSQTYSQAAVTYSYLNGTVTNGEIVVTCLLEDGSQTGSYGDFTYAASTFTPVTTTSVTDTAATSTYAVPTIVESVGDFTQSAPTLEYNLVVVGSPTYTWSFAQNGFGPDAYRLPQTLGAPGTYLGSAGSGATTWIAPPQPLVFINTIRNSLYSPAEPVSPTPGGSNTAFGVEALPAVVNSGSNTAVGGATLRALVTGASNTAVGASALQGMVTGEDNIAVGARTMLSSSGIQNVAIGVAALDGAGAVDNNVAIGHNAMTSTPIGATGNVAIGYRAGFGGGGISNVVIGTEVTASSSLTGTSNIVIGTQAGGSLSSGSNNILIGTGTGTSLETGDNVTLIGANMGTTTGSTSNYVRIGNNNVTLTEVPVAWTVVSDARDKTDIVNLDIGLDFVNQLVPRKFKLANRDTGIATTGDRYGFIAQEIPDAQIVSSVDPEHLKINETMMLAVLVKAVQEQSKIIEALAARVAELEA